MMQEIHLAVRRENAASVFTMNLMYSCGDRRSTVYTGNKFQRVGFFLLTLQKSISLMRKVTY